MNLIDRFLSFVNKTDTCWLWTGMIRKQAKLTYGRFKYKGKKVAAHRLSYELFVGPIPDGLHILHSCDNPICVNPAHLRPGTAKENMQDMIDRGRNKNGGGKAKITEDNVREIRILLQEGDLTQKQIGERYGLCQQAVFDIKHGRNWKHVV